MNSDSYFWIGSTHKVNEDYAISGNKEDMSYAIVSDGCSSSSMTDWGSRILALSAEKVINSPTPFSEAEVLAKANSIRQFIDLDQTSLDATLLVAVQNKNEFFARCTGDGVIAFIRENSIDVYSFEHPSEAPFYINYQSNESRLKNYLNTYGAEYNILFYNILENGLAISAHVGRTETLWRLGKPNDAVAVVIMSDGVRSFYKMAETETSKVKEPIPLPTVLHKMLNFKGYQGGFVQRRMQKFINREMTDLGWYNADDVSVAAIYFGG
jgi:hypothetical protein